MSIFQVCLCLAPLTAAFLLHGTNISINLNKLYHAANLKLEKPRGKNKHANICDNELLICQNGGTCHRNTHCICPRPYTGVMCEKRNCETDPQGCLKAQGAVILPTLVLLLLLIAPLGLSGGFVF